MHIYLLFFFFFFWFCDALPIPVFLRNIFGCTYDTHDAVEDRKYLQKLVERSSILFELQFHNYELYKTDGI